MCNPFNLRELLINLNKNNPIWLLSLVTRSDYVITMSILRVLLLILGLAASVFAQDKPLAANELQSLPAAPAANATLPAVSLPEEKRPLALAFGVVLVLVTFHRAFARRQRA